VFYFEQLFQTALQGIDGTSILTTVLEVAGSLLVLSFLYGAYQAFAAGATSDDSLLPGLNTWYSDWCLQIIQRFSAVSTGCSTRLQISSTTRLGLEMYSKRGSISFQAMLARMDSRLSGA